MSLPPERPMEVAPPAFPLSEASVGTQLWIHSVAGNPFECYRLHEMGFCERAELVKLSHGAMTVCLVCGARVGLSAAVARRIFVTAVSGEAREGDGGAEVDPGPSSSSLSGEGTFFCRILDRFRRRRSGWAE